jgi:hypothetical protein
MVPSGTTVREGKYVTTGGRVKFDEGEQGTITFLAPVSVPLAAGTYTLRGHIVRTVPDLLGSELLLRQVSHVGGNVSTLLSCETVASSSTGGVVNNVRFTDSETKKLTFDLSKFYYWVQISCTVNSPANSSASPDSVRSALGVTLIQA